MRTSATFDDLDATDGSAAETVSLPQPQPFGAPVLIGDCVTPLAGQTLLSWLWQRMDSKTGRETATRLTRQD